MIVNIGILWWCLKNVSIADQSVIMLINSIRFVSRQLPITLYWFHPKGGWGFLRNVFDYHVAGIVDTSIHLINLKCWS